MIYFNSLKDTNNAKSAETARIEIFQMVFKKLLIFMKIFLGYGNMPHEGSAIKICCIFFLNDRG